MFCFLNLVFYFPFISKKLLSLSSHELWETFTNCIIECNNVLSIISTEVFLDEYFTYGILSLKTGYIVAVSEMACFLGRLLQKLSITKHGFRCPSFSLQFMYGNLASFSL